MGILWAHTGAIGCILNESWRIAKNNKKFDATIDLPRIHKSTQSDQVYGYQSTSQVQRYTLGIRVVLGSIQSCKVKPMVAHYSWRQAT